MSDDEISERRLLYDAVREVVGEDGIRALRQHSGGMELYVPGFRLGEASPLVEALGMEAASAVVAKLRVFGADGRPAGGFRVYIALAEFGRMAIVRAAAVEAVRAGMTRRAAAHHVGVSERTVYRAIAHLRRPAESTAAGDAAVIAAYAEHPTAVAMAAHLGIDVKTLHSRLQRVRMRTGLPLALRRPQRLTRSMQMTRPTRAARSATLDAALVAAHAEDPTADAILARLGIGRACLHRKLKLARARTGLPLVLSKPQRPAQPTRPTRVVRSDALDAAEPDGPRRPSRAESVLELIALHAEGLSPEAIAAHKGWTVGYVYCRFSWLRRETGLPFAFSRKPGQDRIWGAHVEARQHQVKTAFRDGLSVREIAGRLKVSESTVKNYLRKLRQATGEAFRHDGPRDHPHTRIGIEHRRALAEAYAPGVTLDKLAAGIGLTVRVAQHHLSRLRRDTGRPFALARNSRMIGITRLPVPEHIDPGQAHP